MAEVAAGCLGVLLNGWMTGWVHAATHTRRHFARRFIRKRKRVGVCGSQVVAQGTGEGIRGQAIINL